MTQGQGIQYFSIVPVLHYLQAVLFIKKNFMNILYRYKTLKWGGTKDYFRQVKVPGTTTYWKVKVPGTTTYWKVKVRGTTTYWKVKVPGTTTYWKVKVPGTITYWKVKVPGTTTYWKEKGPGTTTYWKVKVPGTITYWKSCTRVYGYTSRMELSMCKFI